MRKILMNILLFTGAWNERKRKARFFHPVGFVFFFILLIPVMMISMLIEETIIRVIQDNYCFW